MPNHPDDQFAAPTPTPPPIDTESSDGLTFPSTPSSPHGPRGYASIAWFVIVILVGLKIILTALVAAELEPTADDPIGEMLMRIQCRYIVGAAQMPGGGPELFYAQSEQFNVGNVAQRQRFVVLAAELAGPAEARRRLDELSRLIETEGQELTENQEEVQRILGALYAAPMDDSAEEEDESGDVDLAALSAEDRSMLVEELDWFGELALAPDGADSARRDEVLASATSTMVVILTMFGVGGVVAFGGFVGLVVVLVLAFLGRLRGALHASPTHHGLYAETFALWFGLFMLFQIAAELAGGANMATQMTFVLVAFFGSLVALAWPVVRGVSWSQVRRDIGWTMGRKPIVEPLFGVAGYAMALPILAVGVLLTLALLLLSTSIGGAAEEFAPAGGPAHPIVAELGSGNLPIILLIITLGSIAAPIVEETMFRGVLYRHLRDVSGRFGFVMSVIFACFINAFVFAIIHPQGWIAVPALMSLAIAFSLAREWRGSLLPAMLMHGISNAVVLSFITLLASM